MQIQAGTVRLSGMSDQLVGPLEATPTTCLRMETASAHVREWKKICEKLMRANVNRAPRNGETYRDVQISSCACFDFPAARLRRARAPRITTVAVRKTA